MLHSRILANTSMLQSSHSGQLTVLDDFLQHVLLPAMLPALSCSSPISFVHAQIPARRHYQSTPNASDTSACTKCISGVHWVLVQKMSTHDQLSLVPFDARSRVLSFLVSHSVSLGLRSTRIELQTIRSLSLLASRLRRWSTHISLLR